MSEDLLPPKEAMMERHAYACRQALAMKDRASDGFLMADAWRRETRRAAMACGATFEEIRAIEHKVSCEI